MPHLFASASRNGFKIAVSTEYHHVVQSFLNELFRANEGSFFALFKFKTMIEFEGDGIWIFGCFGKPEIAREINMSNIRAAFHVVFSEFMRKEQWELVSHQVFNETAGQSHY